MSDFVLKYARQYPASFWSTIFLVGAIWFSVFTAPLFWEPFGLEETFCSKVGMSLMGLFMSGVIIVLLNRDNKVKRVGGRKTNGK